MKKNETAATASIRKDVLVGRGWFMQVFRHAAWFFYLVVAFMIKTHLGTICRL